MQNSWVTLSIFVPLLLLALVAPSRAATPEETFFDAARKGDLETIRKLLDDGVDVNARTEYGGTALAFACDKGFTEIVRLLIEKGAQVNVVDTFYGASPYYWALSHEHVDILTLLIRNGAPPDARLLALAVSRDDRDLVQTIVELKTLESALPGALQRARKEGKNKVVAVLEKAGVKVPETSPVLVPPKKLEAYAGSYRNAQIGIEITLRPDEGKLKGTVPGQPEITYAPKDEKTFESVEFPGITIIFDEKDQHVPSLTLKQGPGSFVFDRVEKKAGSEEKKEPEFDSVPPPEVTRPKNWASFRGEQASGVADGQHPPIRWDATQGRNLRWKRRIPGLGHACPVVWEEQVFILTAISGKDDPEFRHGQYGDVDSIQDDTVHHWMLFSLDRDTGDFRWERRVHRGVPKYRRHLKATHANCTPVTDGKTVVVNLGAEGLYAFDFEGQPLWKRELGDLDSGWFYDPEYQWGFSSSPVISDDLVLVQADIQENSFLAAYSLKTGEPVWRTERDEIPSWGTPTVIESEGRTQVVTNSTKAIAGYDVKTGKELWRLVGNSEVTVGTPITGHGLIYFTGGYRPVQPIYAVKVDATGDITLSGSDTSNDGIAWSHNRGGTYMPTPILYGDYLYFCSNGGILTCYDAKTGKRVYRNRIAAGRGGGYTASPVAADGHLYFTSEDGDVHVVKAGPEYELVASNPIGEVCMATPAISNGMIFVRSLDHVYGIGYVKEKK